jgi:hypothetical protein
LLLEDGMPHDRNAENEGLKIAYAAIAPVWPGAQSLPELAPQPRPEPHHRKAAFYQPAPPPCFSGAGSDSGALPAIAPAGRYL